MLEIGWTYAFTLVNLLVLYLIVKLLLWKPITNFIQKRQDKIKEDLTTAAREKATADDALAGISARLDTANRQAEAILAEARKRSEEIADGIIAQAKLEAEAILSSGRARIEAEREEALRSLQDETAALALMAAYRLSEGGVDREAGKRLVKAAIEQAGRN